MESAARYHPLAWAAAFLISASAWAGYFLPDAAIAAGTLLSAIAIAAWIVAKCAAWLRRRTGESRPLSLLRAIGFFALLTFVLYALFVHAWVFSYVYPDPTLNRAYAESLGFEFTPYLLASLVASVVAAGLVFVAARAGRAADPAGARSIWLVCVLAPASWLALGVALNPVVELFRPELVAFGADLPAPTLLLLELARYLSWIAILPLLLSVLGWYWRCQPQRFLGIVAMQVLAVLSASAFFTFSVVAFVLPLIKMCGAV